MGTLTDDDLLHLLGEAGAGFTVPESGPGEVLDAALEAEVLPLRRRRWVQVPAAAAVAAVAVLAGTALFGGGGVNRVEQFAGGEPPLRSAADGAGEAPGFARQSRQESDGGSTGGSAAGESHLDLAVGGAATLSGSTGAAPVPAAPGAKAAPPVTAPVPDGARVVKTGAIALVVDDGQVTPVLTKVQSLATAVGGEVSVAKTAELGPTPSGMVTLRVPVDSFEEVVAQVRSLDADVRSATTAGRDVTAEYSDIETQIRTLSAARERFLEILSRARSIGDVLAVQQRVDDVTARIDRLEGQRRVLASQSERATLEVTVTEADDPVVRLEQPDDGLSKAFSDAWHGFTSGVEGLIRLSGRGVLLVMCLAVAYVVLRLAWRASRRRLV